MPGHAAPGVRAVLGQLRQGSRENNWSVVLPITKPFDGSGGGVCAPESALEVPRVAICQHGAK